MATEPKNYCKPCGGQYNECEFDDNTDPETGCVLQPDGTTKCPEQNLCGTWSLTEDSASDNCYIKDVVEETLKISGAKINVHKLLGIYEQKSLMDVTGEGSSIAGSYLGNFPPFNAFSNDGNEWRSAETGLDVISRAFIGYDFGPIKMSTGRNRYGIETYVKKTISTIKIVQGCNSKNRATKIRVEQSHDGTKWFGVALVNVPDCDGVATLNFKATVPTRYWRIRPVAFNGGSEDYWSVRNLILSEFEKTAVDNVQDNFYLENRDRSYQKDAVTIHASYTPPDRQSINSKWGFMYDLDTYTLEVGFNEVVRAIGRPIVIGDIIELPSEMQYTVDLQPKKAYFEVQDTGWSSSSYTPMWRPTLFKLTLKPAFASQETQDIFGNLDRIKDNTGLFDIDDGNSKMYQDYSAVSQYIKAESNNLVPEKGIDYSEVPELSKEMIEWGDNVGKNMRQYDRNRSIFGIDAMPPNGVSYTEGDTRPENPTDGQYHRLTYTYLPGGNAIPARLYRWSKAKNKWIFIERDRRAEHKDLQPVVNDMKNPEKSTITRLRDIQKELMPE